MVQPHTNSVSSGTKLMGMAVMALGLGVGCAQATVQTRPTADRVLVERIAPEAQKVFQGTWESGTCQLNVHNGKLTYRAGDRRAASVLDIPDEVNLSDTLFVHFSAEKTVIVTSEHLVFAFGGTVMLGGRLMIGMRSDGFHHENTEILNLLQGEGEEREQSRVISATVSSGMLYFMDMSRTIWWIPLSGDSRDISGYCFSDESSESGSITVFRGLVVHADEGRIDLVQIRSADDVEVSRREFEGAAGEISFLDEGSMLRVSIGNRHFRVSVPDAGSLERVTVTESL